MLKSVQVCNKFGRRTFSVPSFASVKTCNLLDVRYVILIPREAHEAVTLIIAHNDNCLLPTPPTLTGMSFDFEDWKYESIQFFKHNLITPVSLEKDNSLNHSCVSPN